MSTRSPDPTWTVPDQTQTHPRPSRFIYSIPEPSAAFLNLLLHRHLLSKHSWSGEHHSFPTNPKHLKSHQLTLSLHAHLWTQKLSIRNCNRVKPKHLASFPIESHSFLSYLLLSISPYPCLVPSCHSFPLSTLYLSSAYHTLSYHYTSCPYPYNYTQTILSGSPSLVLPSISSLCTLCIPQSEYHLWYSLLWSDPIHILSLTCPQLAHLWPFSSSMTSMPRYWLTRSMIIHAASWCETCWDKVRSANREREMRVWLRRGDQQHAKKKYKVTPYKVCWQCEYWHWRSTEKGY